MASLKEPVKEELPEIFIDYKSKSDVLFTINTDLNSGRIESS